jgi:hypothetical protein
MEAIDVVLTALAAVALTLCVELQGWYDKDIKAIKEEPKQTKAGANFSTVKDYLLLSCFLYFVTAVADVANDYHPAFLATTNFVGLELLTGFLASVLLIGAVFFWRQVDHAMRDWSSISPPALSQVLVVILILALDTSLLGSVSMANPFGDPYAIAWWIAYVGGAASLLKPKRISMRIGVVCAAAPWLLILGVLVYIMTSFLTREMTSPIHLVPLEHIFQFS